MSPTTSVVSFIHLLATTIFKTSKSLKKHTYKGYYWKYPELNHRLYLAFNQKPIKKKQTNIELGQWNLKFRNAN